jgi:2,4-dienoyl-CoA reductase-like NADH-dependent reductase (Old Yellow Enzyme family)
MCEASAVEPRGRISLQDAGLWNEAQAAAWRPVTAFIRAQGAAAGMQLAHAGRKAGTHRPWEGRSPYTDEQFTDGRHSRQELWPVAPSALPYDSGYRTPQALAPAELAALKQRWVEAAQRALAAGFNVLELHMAHGYLLHEFLSPLSNRRDDGYGGSLEGRMRYPLEVAQAVRSVWPDELPLLARISATDWAEGGWDIAQSVDLVDTSSGALTPAQQIPRGADGQPEPGYQTPFAAQIRREAGIATATVGLITQPQHAAQIIAEGQADLVLLGRELLRRPYWAQHAARELGAQPAWPPQYGWAVG